MGPDVPRSPSISSRLSTHAVNTVIAVSMLLYALLATAAHYSLRTNAFDLSLFDYAMWNTVHGRPGWIPFVGHTIFSEHFMPILLLLAPIYSVCQLPVALIVFQLCAVGLAAVLLSAIGKTVHLEPIASAAIVGAFLLSRASFFATTSFFYPESLQPVFVFGCVLAWRLRRRLVYWICLVLLLSTKEDATIYVAAFAAIRFLIDSPRRDSVFTFAIAVVWLLFAVGVAIPHSRAIDGLPASNPFLHARYATPGGDIEAGEIVARVFSIPSFLNSLLLLGAFGLLPLVGPEWLLVITPGVFINLAAEPLSMQSTLAGHYSWPLLPWLAVASEFGYARIQDRAPRTARLWGGMLAAATVATSPMFRTVNQFMIDPRAAQARRQMPDCRGRIVAAQPNLVPHLPHDNRVLVLGRDRLNDPQVEIILFAPIGDLWPLSRDEIAERVKEYDNNRQFVTVASGPLFAFEPRSAAPSPR